MMKNDRRQGQQDFDGEDRRSHVHKNYSQSSQMYQLEQAVRVVFDPDYNVWQVYKMDYPSYQQIRYEVVGYHNSNIAFDFAVIYIKMLKYGLDDEEMAKLDRLGYEPIEVEKKSTDDDTYNKGEQE